MSAIFSTGDTELVSKVRVMAQYDAGESIAIRDSVTDINMALQAPIVFARARLAQYLDLRQKPYIPWNGLFRCARSLNPNVVKAVLDLREQSI